MRSGNFGRIALGVVIVILLIVLAVSLPYQKVGLSSIILPTYEGLGTYFFGANPPQTGNTVYTANNNQICPNIQGGCNWVQSIPSNGNLGSTGYSWAFSSQSPEININQHGCTILCSTYAAQIAVDVTTFNPSINPVTGNTNFGTINYNVSNPYGAGYVQVVGQIIVQGVDVTIQVLPNSEQSNPFQSFVLWMQLYSSSWNNYQPLSSSTTPNTGQALAAWSAPILLYLQSGSASSGAENVATTPSYTVTQQSEALYNVPQSTSNVGFSISSPSKAGSVDASLASVGSPYAPDTRMSEFAYFPITLNNFGSYACGTLNLETCYPQITLHFDVYMLQIGQYLWNNPITTGQSTTTYNNGNPCFFVCLPNLNLGSLFALGSGIGTAVVIGIIIIILVIFGPAVLERSAANKVKKSA